MIRPMRAATVAILMDKGRFEPHAALAVAEAIENEMQSTELVTVPVLDARLAKLQTDLEGKIGGLEIKMAGNKAELVRWVFASMIGQVAMLSGIMYFLLHAVR